MSSRLTRLLLILLLALPAGQVVAGNRHGDLPPDDRRELRRQMREHWLQENVDRRYQANDNQPVRWRELPPEERQRLRDEMRRQHDSYERDDRSERRSKRRGGD